jgi:heat shock protein HslJ
MLKIFLAAIGVTVALAFVVSLIRSAGDTLSQSNSNEGMQQEETVAALEKTSWMATKLQTTDVSSAGITALFQDGTLSGSDGCNRYTTSYTVNGASLMIKTPMAGTMMACPAATMALATKYTTALAQVSSYSIEDNSLFLKDDSGTTVITYREDAQTLSDTNWNVTGLNNGKQAVVSVITGSTITLNFTGETQVSGNAGCNTYSGGYSATGSTISIGELASTMMACIEPEGVSDQESLYLKALKNSTTFKIENNSLVMRDDSGAMQVTAARD